MPEAVLAPSLPKQEPTFLEKAAYTAGKGASCLASFSLRSVFRVTGVFIGSNLAAGFCLLYAPQIIYALNYTLASSIFGCSGIFASSTSLISLGYTYEWVNLGARAVGGAIGYGAVDILIDGSAF